LRLAEGRARARAAEPDPPRDPVAVAWELLHDATGLPGALNMAVDQALLDRAERTGAATLRLYRWKPACLSFGRHEPATRRYDRTLIERLGIDVVRRPTGGRAVWHEHEVTYAVAAPVARFGSLRASYRAIHELLARALRRLGAEVTLAPDRPEPEPRDRPGACFATPGGGELVVAGRKLVGSAQVRQGGALLQHGSILLAGAQDLVDRVSREPGATGGATTLARVLGRTVSFGEVADAVSAAFGCGPETEPATLTPDARAPESLINSFLDPSWTWRR
jgi:lipoate-protein ligase A